MRNVAEIYPKYISNSGENLTVIICSCLQAPQKISQNTPYALVNLNKTTLIEQQINNVQKVFPKSEILIVVGYEAYKIYNKLKRKNIRLIYNPNFDTTNSLYNFGLGLYNNLNSHVLYIDGQTLFDANSIKDILDKNSSQIVIDHKHHQKPFPGITLDGSGRVVFFSMD